MFVIFWCMFIFCVFYIFGNIVKIKYDYKFVFILIFFFRIENGNIIF